MPFVSTFVVNQPWFDAQTKELQDAIVKAAQDSVAYTIEQSDKLNAERKDKMAKLKPSLVFYELTPEEQAPFRAKAPDIEVIFVKMAGPMGEKLLTDLKAEREALEAAKK